MTRKDFSAKEYEHVVNVGNNFEMKTVKDYLDLYWTCKILLLADVSEKFRNNSLKNYGLFPSHCVSASDLSWGAMLKMMKVEPELMADPDLFIFSEKGTRGGISHISNRYRKADNRYLKSYNPKQK